MHCTERDQDILLLQHGELSVWQAFWVRQHIAACPHCQEKQAEFTRTSRLLASVIRQGSRTGSPGDFALPAWAFRTTAPAFTLTRSTFIAAAGTVAALVAAGMYAFNAVASAPSGGQTTRALFSPAPQVNAKDASGHATIFPFSTPNTADDCKK